MKKLFVFLFLFMLATIVYVNNVPEADDTGPPGVHLSIELQEYTSFTPAELTCFIDERVVLGPGDIHDNPYLVASINASLINYYKITNDRTKSYTEIGYGIWE